MGTFKERFDFLIIHIMENFIVCYTTKASIHSYRKEIEAEDEHHAFELFTNSNSNATIYWICAKNLLFNPIITDENTITTN